MLSPIIFLLLESLHFFWRPCAVFYIYAADDVPYVHVTSAAASPATGDALAAFDVSAVDGCCFSFTTFSDGFNVVRVSCDLAVASPPTTAASYCS